MKPIFFIAVLLLGAQAIFAQDRALHWKYKDYDGAIAFSVPRWATFVGASFLDKKEDRKLLRKVRKVRVLVFEEGSPFTERDLRKFTKRAKRRHLDELITVRSGKTRVHIMAKDRNNSIRKAVVLFQTPEASGLVTVKGKFGVNDINKIIERTSAGKKSKDGTPVVPNVPKIPVIRA